MKKFMTILLVCALTLSMLAMPVFAFSGLEDTTPKAPGTAATTAKTLIEVIQWIGYAIAVGMLVYVGIKYIMASANDKAEIKNALLKYVLGAVLIAGAGTIAGWVFAIMK